MWTQEGLAGFLIMYVYKAGKNIYFMNKVVES